MTNSKSDETNNILNAHKLEKYDGTEIKRSSSSGTPPDLPSRSNSKPSKVSSSDSSANSPSDING